MTFGLHYGEGQMSNVNHRGILPELKRNDIFALFMTKIQHE